MSTSIRLPTLGALAAAVAGCAIPPDSAPIAESRGGCTDKVRLYETARSTHGVSLAIESRCHVPLTIEVAFPRLENLEPDRATPVRVVLEPGASVPLVRLKSTDPAETWRYGASSLFFAGRGDAMHEDSMRYAFPFPTSEPRKCLQGPNGKVSHTGRHAYDFQMPIGTPVLAARDGIVFRTLDGFGEGRLEERFKQRSNNVIVLHSDDTIATYGHLRSGVVVEEGDAVVAGQLLGYSGNSGYSSGPHLHFDVSIPGFGEPQTLPILFVDDVAPVQGKWYPREPFAPVESSATAPTPREEPL